MSLLDVLHVQLGFERRVDRLADALAARLPPNARVLDIGCGDGSIAHVTVRGCGTDVRLHPTAPSMPGSSTVSTQEPETRC